MALSVEQFLEKWKLGWTHPNYAPKNEGQLMAWMKADLEEMLFTKAEGIYMKEADERKRLFKS